MLYIYIHTLYVYMYICIYVDSCIVILVMWYIFKQKYIQDTIILNMTEDATPPVLNQLPYSLKSYDDKAVRENGRRDLTRTSGPPAQTYPAPKP